MAKPTILCLVADINPNHLGGAEVHFVEVARRLSSSFKLILVTGPDSSVSTLLPQAKVIPVSYPKIPNFYGLSFILKAYLHLIRHPQHFDLIWAKQCYPQAPLGTLLKLKQKKPLYITAQNPRLHHEELVVSPFLKPFHRLLASFLDPLISWSLKKADLVAAVSTYSALLAKNYGAPNIVIIPNGVNPKDFSPSKHPSRHKSLRLLTTSALIPRNGIDILIKATSLLPQKLDWHLTIAGTGPQEIYLKSLSKEHKVSNRITFLGRVQNTQVPDLLHQADIFIRPSRHEGFGVSFIEAMAAGVPVIATPVGGIPDFVIHRHTGLLAKSENPQSVADQIILLASGSKLSSKLSQNALKLVQDKYTWDKVSHQVKSAFDNLLSKPLS